MKPDSGAKKSELDRTEWNFRSIPKSEVETCFIYEYARELVRRSPRISDLLARWKAGCKAREKTPEWYEGNKACIELIKALNICFPDCPSLILEGFPDSPWQELSQKVRAKLVEETTEGVHHNWNRLPYDKLHLQTLRALTTANVRSIETFRYFHEIFHNRELSETEYGFFAINWGYPDPEIRRAFGKWLSEQSQGREKRGLREIKYKPRGRGALRDQLNWLGALRVKEHYPRKQLVNYPHPSLKVTARPYWNLTDLYDGAKKAREVLSRLSRMADRS